MEQQRLMQELNYHRAQKAAEKMSHKHGVHFSVYKCLHCDGWHVGRNKDNKVPANTSVSNN